MGVHIRDAVKHQKLNKMTFVSKSFPAKIQWHIHVIESYFPTQYCFRAKNALQNIFMQIISDLVGFHP